MVCRVYAALLFGLTFAVLGVESAGASKWLRLRSAHFVLVGDAGEANLRQVAQRVEAFREALRQSLPDGSVASPVPTILVVFGSDESFTPFKPLFRGKPLERIAGYFQGGEDVNYITLNVAGRDEAYSIVFHEFAHALINNTMTSVPMWANEGLAEVYRTFSERDGGRTAIIGLAPPEHVLALRRQTFMPLAELMGVGRESPIYNEGDRRGIFYAESWALTHYLLLGNNGRGPQLRQYLLDLNAGLPSQEAFRHAFQTEPRVLENEVREYVRQFLFPARQIKFDQSFHQATAQAAEPLSDPEMQAYLADLLAHGNRVDEARAQLERVLTTDPNAPRALAALGALHTRARRVDEALPLLERAAALAPQDPSILASFGEALAVQLRLHGAAFADAELLKKASAVLEKAAALDQDNAHLVALRGDVEAIAGERLGEARGFLERAVKMAPVRENYRFMLADVYIRQQDTSPQQPNSAHCWREAAAPRSKTRRG